MQGTSAAVRKIVSGSKLLNEGMRQGILSHAAVARRIKPRVEAQIGKKAAEPAIIMALRRCSEEIRGKSKSEKLGIGNEISMKTGLSYLSFSRTPRYLEKLLEFCKKTDAGRETFNLIQGDHEFAVIASRKHSGKIRKLIGESSLRIQENDLVSISMSFSKDFAYTPGMIYAITRKLYWDGINVFELITTATQLSLLFEQKNATRAYDSICELAGERSGAAGSD